MKEAKTLILNMVREGKITADEGAKLLEAMNPEPEYAKRQASDADKSTIQNGELGAEIRNRLNGIYKDVEPSIKRTILSALESALETAALVSTTVRESINESIRGEVKIDEH